MKKSIIFLLVVFVSSICSGQKNIDKMMEKYNVSSAVVSGHLFAVGDTLSLGSGSLPNGEFLCSMLSPDLLLKPGVYPPHLPANYLNFKFIIAKIRHQDMGLNSTTTLVFYINTQTMVWIDPAVGIAKNEILIK